MGLPTKCMHFVGSPGRRGYNTPMSGDASPIKLYFLRALVWAFFSNPGQMGTDFNHSRICFSKKLRDKLGRGKNVQ